MPTVYDLTLEQLTDRLVAWGEPAFRAKQVWRQLWTRAATYDQMPDVPAEAAGAARGRTAPRGRGPGRTHSRPRCDPQGIAQARRSARRRGRAHGLPRSRHGLRVVAGRLCDGVHVLRDRPDGAAEQPHDRRDRGPGGVGAPRSGAPPRHDAAAADERRVHGDGGALREPASRLRRAGATDRSGALSASAPGTSRSRPWGSCPGIRHLAERFPQVGLAVSFHAASDSLRDELVPPNERYPLAKLEDAIAAWRAITHRRPSIEWALIDRVNDTDRAGGAAGADRAAPRRARQPDPVEPDARLPGPRLAAGAHPALRADAREARRERHGARYARAFDRRRVRPARARGDELSQRRDRASTSASRALTIFFTRATGSRSS